MREYMTLTGWYETENGYMNVHIEGHSFEELVIRLRDMDPENFGYTDMELEVCIGDKDPVDVTNRVYDYIADPIS